MPAAAVVIEEMVGFCKVDVDGVPPGNVQFQDVTLPVDISENCTGEPTHGNVSLAENSEATVRSVVRGTSHMPRPYSDTRSAD